MWRHRNVYICAWSGAAHVCSPLACDRLRETEEHMVCTLTGLTYDLDFQVTYEQGAISSESRRLRQVTSAKRKRKRCGGTDGMSTATPSPSPPPPSGVSAGAVDLARTNEIYDVDALVSGLLPELPLDKRKDLRNTILVCYNRVRQTEGYLRVAGEYTIAVHTVATLYSMAQGGERYRTFTFIEADAEVRASLKTVNSQPSEVINARTRKHLRCSSGRLKAFMYAWVDRFAPRIATTHCK